MLNGFWITLSIYILHVGIDVIKNDKSVVPQPNWEENTTSALASFFFLVYDWLFIEQYVSACLMMPITIAILDDDQNTN